MDARIGDLLTQLRAMGAEGNTIVVFTSDNGADVNGRNLPFRGQKSLLWEGGIRVPLHIRWPDRIPAGAVVNQVAMTMDLAPTLARGNVRTDGIDLLPFVTGKQGPVARTVFWRYKRGEARRKAVRHADWKYVEDGDTLALHELGSDPLEQRNLLRDRAEIVRDLRTRLAAWEKEVEAPRLRGFRPA
jgi:arylsulfatase A-like enzyme